jgi:uroporphyrinogen-III synthase
MLRQLGLMPDLAAATPTSQGVLDALAGEHINGRGIGLQLYPGEGVVPLVSELRRRGAVIFPVTPYRYASQTETARVLDMVSALASGRIDMIAFTSSPQVERLFEVAREAGIAKQFDEVLQHTRIAAIGPIVEQTLRLHGVTAVLRPETSFHLKPFVRAIAAAWGSQ